MQEYFWANVQATGVSQFVPSQVLILYLEPAITRSCTQHYGKYRALFSLPISVAITENVK